MIDFQSVKLEAINFSAIGLEEIKRNLGILFTTPAGSVPYDREFGVNIDFLDQPIPIAKNMLTIEYAEKTRRFEPRASVLEVHFDPEPDIGKLIPRVVIAIAE